MKEELFFEDNVEFYEELIISKDFLQRATDYLSSIGVNSITAYGKNAKLMNIKSNQKPRIYSVKQFFIKLCHTSGLFKAVTTPHLQSDINFALLCAEQQPLCYPDLPKDFQQNPTIMEICYKALTNYDINNYLDINYKNIKAEDFSLLLNAKLQTRYNSEYFNKLARDNPKLLKKDYLKDMIKYNPNILEYTNNLKYEPDVINFINNLPLANYTVNVRRIIGKKINDSYYISKEDKITFAPILERFQRFNSFSYEALPYRYED